MLTSIPKLRVLLHLALRPETTTATVLQNWLRPLSCFASKWRRTAHYRKIIVTRINDNAAGQIWLVIVLAAMVLNCAIKLRHIFSESYCLPTIKSPASNSIKNSKTTQTLNISSQAAIWTCPFLYHKLILCILDNYFHDGSYGEFGQYSIADE